MKKRFLFFIAALLCATSMWAVDDYTPTTLNPKPTEGPWTFDAVNNGYYSSGKGPKSFNELDHSAWEERDNTNPITYQFNDDNGLGFAMHCKSVSKGKTAYGIYSTYKNDTLVPSYTRLRLTWNYKIRGRVNKFNQLIVLYTHTNLEELKAAHVFFPDAGYPIVGWYRINFPYYQTSLIMKSNGHTETTKEENRDQTYDFDNRESGSNQTKSWYLLMTYAVADLDDDGEVCHQWGCFKTISAEWEAYYYKYLTFDANGGSGKMKQQTIENSGNLTANTFTRHGYTFAGWATTPDGEAVYADGGEITATLDSKGPATLYAKWLPANYAISYELDGGSVSKANPATYTIETATFTLNNPSKDGYAFFGWTGSNGKEPQLEVIIAQGSTGDKNFVANWLSNDVVDVKARIDAIPNPVVYPDSKTAIDAARAAFEALSDDNKAKVTATELKKLQAAEAAYAEAGKSTVHFVDKIGNPISSQEIALYYPTAPTISGFTFQYWQVVERNISDGLIHIQAVYKSSTPTAIDDANANAKAKAAKLIRNGNLYILTDEFIYTIKGQRVK